MSFQKHLVDIKNAKVPFYIRPGFDEGSTHLCLDPTICCEAHRFVALDLNPESPRENFLDTSPILARIGNNPLQTPGTCSIKKLDKKSILARTKKLVKRYFFEDQVIKNPKIKSHSLERVTPPELCNFSLYNHTLKEIKRKCNVNLWHLLEKTKEFHRDSRSHSLELENLANERQNAAANIKAPKTNSPTLTKQPSLPQITSSSNINTFLNSAKIGKNLAGKKVPNLSLKTLIPGIFASKPDTKLNAKLPSEPLCKPISSPYSDKVLYKKLLKIISQTKYVIAQVGYLLHYEQLSNPVADLISLKTSQRQSLAQLISTSSIDKNSKNYSDYSTALQLSSIQSIDTEEKMPSARTDASIFEQFPYSSRFTNYVFEVQSCLDDHDEKVVQKRLEKLYKYSIGKVKKWLNRKKKAELEKKYQNYEIVCKICEEKIQIEKMKEHSFLCRIRFEANKKMKDVDNKIGDAIFEAYMKGKELETSLRIDHKNYFKLKNRNERSRAGTPTTQSLAKSVNANLMKEAGRETSYSNSPNLRVLPNTDPSDFLRPGPRKRTGCFKQRGDPVITRSQSGKTEELKSCIEDLNKSSGFLQGSNDDNDKFYCQDLSFDDNREPKKTCVGRFLDKQNLKCEDSQSFDSEDLANNRTPLFDIPMQKSQSEVKSFSPEEPNLHYFSDPQKSDVESEQSFDSSKDSKPTEGGSLAMYVPFRMFESSGGSDSVVPNETSGSDKSVKGSPINNRLGTSGYKKSKFYNENAFTFENSKTPETKSYADDEGEGKENKEENKTAESDLTGTRLIPQRSLGVIHPEKFSSGQEKSPAEKMRTYVKQHTMMLPQETRESSLNRPINTKQTEDLIKLRQQINKKKDMVRIYEICTAKGKIIMNKEPYQWKMEKLREEIRTELEELLKKIDNEQLKAFTDNVLKLIDKRIQSGKMFQEAKKLIDQLQNSSSESQSPNLSIERLSMLREKGLPLSKKRVFDRSPIGKRLTKKLPSATLRNLKGLIEEDLPTLQPPEKILDLYPSRNQPTFGESNDNEDDEDKLSQSSLNFADFEHPFDNTKDKSDKSPYSKLLSDKSSGKPSEVFDEQKLNKGELNPPSPFSEKSMGPFPSNIIANFQAQVAFDQHQKPISPIDKRYENRNVYIEEPEEEKEEPKVKNKESNPTEVLSPQQERPPPALTREFTIMNIDSPFKFEQTEIQEESQQEEKDIPVISTTQQNVFQVTPGNQGLGNEPGSPETPSFEIKNPPPLIWRTSTAPTRTMREIKKELKSGNKSTLKGIIESLRIANKESTESLENKPIDMPKEEQEETSKISESPSSEEKNEKEEKDEHSKSGRKPKTLLVAPRAINRKEKERIMTFRKKLGLLDRNSSGSGGSITPPPQEEQEEEKHLASMFTSAINKNAKFFAEDIKEQNENEENNDSPTFLESPLLQKGYHSDTQMKSIRASLKKSQPVGVNDFEPIKLISKGAFGRVWLVRRKATNDLYAMKVINLAEKSAKNPQDLENLRKENKILGIAQEDFVVRAVFTFTHETCICFVMEYMIGGDFGDILYNYNALDEDVARFYIAEIVLALEYLHSLGIVHRDLKPDNILMDKTGHAKLTDFGLSESGLSQKIKKTRLFGEPESPLIFQRKFKALDKFLIGNDDLDPEIDFKLKGKVMEVKKKDITEKGRTEEDKGKDSEKKTSLEGGSSDGGEKDLKKKLMKKEARLIGTPDYMAPEIITGQSIKNFSIDWWSLGVMLFEFLVGIPPFNDDTPEKIFDNIVKLRVPWDQINIGYDEDSMSPEAADLIRKLLELDPKKRLGASNVNEIKEHPFFKGINWEMLRKQQAPIIPEPKGEIDTSNFVRMAGKITEKDRESPFMIQNDPKVSSNILAAKAFLSASSDKFNMLNVVALESENLRMVEEALKQKEKELNQFNEEDHEVKASPKIYDDLFDTK